MTLLKTKPSWAPRAVATNRGWQDPVSGEVYVAIGNLKSILEAEGVTFDPPKKERKKREKREVITEVTEQPLAKGQQVIGEVVELNDVVNIVAE